jgi:hypothetical protein
LSGGCEAGWDEKLLSLPTSSVLALAFLDSMVLRLLLHPACPRIVNLTVKIIGAAKAAPIILFIILSVKSFGVTS